MNTKLFFTAMLIIASFNFAICQNYWETSDNSAKGKQIIENKVAVNYYDVYTLDFTSLNAALQTAPMRGQYSKGNQLFITFPNAEGQLITYNVVEAPVLHPDLGAQFPGIKSYSGQGVDDPNYSIRFSVSDQRGLYGMIFTGEKGTSFIDPYSNDLTEYMVYSKKDMIRTADDEFVCSLPDTEEHHNEENNSNKATNDSKLRVYRLALSCTAEYGNIFAGSGTNAQKIANILAQMNITMTRVNGVYEKDLAVTMEIIPNNNLIMYFGTVTSDPWTNEWNTKTAQTIDAAIGVANYDIGHNFNTTGGGNAGCIACVCLSTSQSGTHKGRGYTGRSNPTGDAFDIDYVAHEMGHQFGGYHTMNTCSRSGSGSTEVEPTSGSTIMGYAGICTYNVQANSDAYFAYVNIRDISANVKTGNSSSCPQLITIANNPPTANAGLNYTIPKSTAFVLTGVGTDPDGDPLNYTWEQNDPAQAPAATAPVSTWTVGPLFRSITGTSSPMRYFPNINAIIANNLAPAYEVIPSVGRTMNFSLVVRDNVIIGGQTADDLMVVTVNGTAGPFTVTAPTTAVTWAAGSTQTVTWNVSGTTAAPVSCANVDIFLSTDGGFTYPYTILAGTPNDGTQTITVPNNPSTTCRVMVRGANNIFFDISNANFTITGSLTSITSGTITGSPFCAGVPVSVPYTMSGTFNAGNVFTAQLSDAAGSFTTPVNIGTLTSTTNGTIAATIPGGTPLGAGYRIRVIGSSPATTGTDNGVNLNVNASLTPAVAVAGTSTICAGTSVTFTATPTNGGTPSYQWKLNGANVGTNSATYTNAALVNGNTVQCVMTTTVACPTTPTATSNTVTMTVNPTVTPSVAIAGTSTICAGTSTTFTATPTNGGTPTYQWKLNGANVGTNSVTYTNATLSNSDIVTCVMTTSVACPTTPTATSNAVTMTVNPTVTPAVAVAGSSTICTGTSVTFTATPTNGGTPTYQWKLNGANVGTNSTTYTNAALANGNTIQCVMTTTVACPTSPTATSNTVTMTVNPVVTPAVSIAGTSTICAGTSTTFTATPTNGGTPTYQWKLNGANVGTNSATYTNATLANSDIVTCVMTTSVACPTTPTATSNAVTMTVNPTVTPSVAVAGTSTICTGTSVTFTATPTNGGTPTYQWKLNGANVGTNSATYTNATLANSDIVTCVMTTSVACPTTPTATSNAVTMTVNPTVNPAVAVSASSSTICTGTSVTFTATPTNGGTPSYQWKLNGANVGTNSPTYTNATLANSDIVTCVMTTSVACPTTPTATSNAITMTVNSALTPAVAISASLTTICTGTSVTFTATPTNGGTPTYQWQLNGSNIGTNSSTYSNGTLVNSDIVTCVMTTSLSCATVPTATSNTVLMTVNPVVTPAIAISASSSTICAGTSVTFTATPTNGGTPSYQWQLNAANVGTNSATYSNSALVNSDIVSCIMTTSVACPTTPTVTSNSVTMTVNPPNIVPTVSIAGTSTICAGSVTTFVANPTNGGTPSYQWILNGSNVGTNSSTYSNGSLVNNDIVSCVMTTTVACATTPTVTSNLVTMTVNAVPNVSAGPDQIVCEGSSVTLTAGGASTYFWNNGVVDGVSFVPSTGVFIYSVTGISNGCSNTDQVVVTVNSAPNVSAGANQFVCEGSSVTLSGSGATTYSWDNGINNGTPFTPALGTTTYTLTGNSNGCVGTDQVDVIVNAMPVVSAGADQTVCEGSNLTLSGSGASTYYWNNGVIDGTPFIPLLGVHIYNVTGVENGCSNTDQVVVTVNASPIVFAGIDQVICLGASVTLSGSGASSYSWDNGVINGTSFTPTAGTLNYTLTGTTNGCYATDVVAVTVNVVDNYSVTVVDPVASVTALINATYQWIDCDNGNAVIAGETNTDFAPALDGNYAVVVSQNGCTSISSCVQITVTTISQNQNSYSVNVFPNPSYGIINIAFENEMNDVNIVIENVIGQRVYEINSNQARGSVNTIDLSKYSKGVYFINVRNKNADLRYKIVLQK